MLAKMSLWIGIAMFVSAIAHAADIQVFQAAGDSVFAFFESTDDSGCIITDVTVSAGVGTIHVEPGGPALTQGGAVAMQQFNACTQVFLLTAESGTANIQFSLANDLSSATLSMSMLLSNVVTGTTFTVTVNMTWTGFGEAQHSAGNVHINSPGGTNVAHTFNSFLRMGQATGVVTDGSNNFTPQPSTNAELEHAQQMQVTVTIDH